MHAANLEPTLILLLTILHFCPSLSWRRRTRIFDCAFVCVCMASLQTSLSSTKICQNLRNTYSLEYTALLLDSGFGHVLSVKTSKRPFFARQSAEFTGKSSVVSVPITAPGCGSRRMLVSGAVGLSCHPGFSPSFIFVHHCHGAGEHGFLIVHSYVYVWPLCRRVCPPQRSAKISAIRIPSNIRLCYSIQGSATFSPSKHQKGLSSLANPLNSLEKAQWSLYRSRPLGVVADACWYLEP